MTPSVFKGTEATDEYSLSKTTKGKKALEQHRRTFIQESDFAWLQTHGISLVRIPVGYWLFDGDDPYIPCVKYLDWAMEMSKKYGLSVVIDLHAHKGSQNGNDHSGRTGAIEWFDSKDYQTDSLEQLERIARRYKEHPSFWGLQLINEPQVRLFHRTLRRFYKDAEKVLSGVLLPRTRIIFSDGFTPRLMSGALRHSKHPIVMDVHLYHSAKFWTPFVPLSWYYLYFGWQKRLLKRLSKKQAILIGEWSGVFRQKIFNQYPTAQHGELIKEHVRKQRASFEPIVGWCYWNYKTEKPGVWDFRSQVGAGIIDLR